MGAGSRGEGGGEEEGGGIWAPAPFIAAARRVGVLCSRSHGGANSCYQQAPGRLQHCGRRHHPVASDRRGGNAGERRGRRPPRPKPGTPAWSGLRRRTLPGQSLRPAGRGRCLGLRVPGLCGACPPWLPCTGAGTRGLARRRGAEPARRAWRVPGAGWGRDELSGGTGVLRDRARLSPRASVSKGTWGTRGARGAHWLVGATSPFSVGFRAVGCFISLLLLRGCGISIGTACGRGSQGRCCVAPEYFSAV